MKKTAKIISASLATLLITSSAVTAFAAEEKDINVSLRIEGIDSCLLYNSYELSEGSTASDLIQYADKLSDAITVTGAENGYITDVNGETAGKFGGWDGWQYTVNAVSPSVGVNDYTLSNNDTVVLYYGDYPCFIPQIDTSALNTDGKLSFTAEQTTYDSDWNPTVSTVAIADMTVTFDGHTYTTDENGSITLSKADFTSGEHSVQVAKKNANGAPAVCRYADDFTVSIARENTINVSLRIEGPEACYLYDTFEIAKDSNVGELVSYADEVSDDIEVVGADKGYISEVNGIAAGSFGGWDGWYYAVNSVVPNVGVSGYTLSDNDTVVLYYGEYPCYLPIADTSALATEGKITFTAKATFGDATLPIDNMTVYFDGKEYTTDYSGVVVIDEDQLTFGDHSLQVEKYGYSGAPAVLRYANDYTVFVDTKNTNDVNLDGSVDINDVTAIQSYLSSSVELNAEQVRIADIDRDGKVDVNDVTALQTSLANAE
ncbi:DUF4430 domain-containing protein [Ruminococcus sp.]|uniref:DUF4430 domain-containing protein n=1 Tax=Ruminococcus sp. TaxID=41978 RepID=UPI0038691553